MSLENVVQIGRLALTDEKLRTELLTAVKGKTAPEAAAAAAAFANDHGFSVTKEDVVKGYDILLKLQKGGEGELSDEELAAVAGGDAKETGEAVGQAAVESGPEIAAQVIEGLTGKE